MLIQQAITDLQNLTQVKVSYGQIAKILGISTQAVSNRVARKVALKDFEIKKIEDAFDVVLDGNRVFIEDMNDKSGEISVDYYPDVFGSCGGGNFVFSETKYKINIPKRLITNYLPLSKYSVINAFGDSMTPYIQDKDLLIVEHSINTQIYDNRVYVFRYNDHLFVKRLVFNINQLIIKSDNSAYDTIKLTGKDLEDFQIIGRIVGLMQGM